MWRVMRMKKTRHRNQGFTLIEILLVIVVVSILMVMATGFIQQKTESLRRDKTALQMQQIMNAALTYYVTNGQWPANSNVASNGLVDFNHDLIVNNYIPPGQGLNKALLSPYGTNYYTIADPVTNNFYVLMPFPLPITSTTPASATMIAGVLPF